MRFNASSFINEVRKRPVLWDSRNKEFTSEERNVAWNELCDLYNNAENIEFYNQTDLNQILQKKWKNLRDSYVKFFKRKQTNPDSSINFRFAKQLSFLDKVISSTNTGRRTSEKKEDGEEERDGMENEEIQNTCKKPKRVVENHGIESPEEINVDEIYHGESSIDLILDHSMDESPSLKTSNSQYEGFGHFTENRQYGDRNDFFEQSNVKNSNAQERDECTIYGELVGVKLRKLSPRTRAYVQHLVNNTLFEAEMGKYNNSTAIFISPSEENEQLFTSERQSSSNS